MAKVSNATVSILLCIWLCKWVTANGSNNDFYTAAVVEFVSPTAPNMAVLKPQGMIDSTLNEYLSLINEATDNSVDIIVFPEGTLNYIGIATRKLLIKYAVELNETDIYNSTSFNNNCDYSQKSYIVSRLSSKIKQNRVYVLVNVIERVKCVQNIDEKCNDGHFLYSTNLVFDRNGCIISRYRKFNSKDESMINTSDVPEAKIFNTDFGVTFGHFTSLDILFKFPAFVMVQHLVRHILFPTFWFSSLPFYTATQFQQSYSYENNIVLLSAGGNYPMTGQGGSGIYIGKSGATGLLMPGEDTQQMIISKVPKDIDTFSVQVPNNVVKHFNSKQMDELFVTTIPLDYTESLPNQWEKSRRICKDKLCCEFMIKYEKNDITKSKLGYHYRLAISTGKSESIDKKTKELYCAIVACTNDNTKSCGSRYRPSDNVVSSVSFNEISIRMTIEIENTEDDYLIMPTNVDFLILPLKTNEFDYEKSSIFTLQDKFFKNYTTTLTNAHNEILTFGISGKHFLLKEISIKNENKLDNSLMLSIGLGFIVFMTVLKFM